MTYPTYQAAKIANPDCNIYTHGGLFSNEKFNSLPYVNGWRPCNPADYCMTVRQFLDAGHKFVEGDIFLNLTGNVKIVPGSNVWLDSLNCEDKNDKERYILEAKALKETKTYRYEKVTDSIFDLKEEFERGDLFSRNDKGKYRQIKGETWPVNSTNNGNVYRRIEVTEREFAIEQAAKIMYDADQSSGQINDLTLGALFDAGMLKLVNGKG